MTNTAELTEKETEIMKGILACLNRPFSEDYEVLYNGDHTNFNMPYHVFAGIVSSLNKKGLLYSSKDEKDAYGHPFIYVLKTL